MDNFNDKRKRFASTNNMSSSQINNEIQNSNTSFIATQVALQTMKDRCQTLQARLNIVEEENFGLKNGNIHLGGISTQFEYPNSDSIGNLERKIMDLQQQKLQLTERIEMISTENRQLWSRLSQLSKENNSDVNNKSKLIRSKTFTQQAPNPNLRYKNIDEKGCDVDNESSLEEIVLKNDIALNHMDPSNSELRKMNTSFGFGYLNDDAETFLPTQSGEVISEIKKNIDFTSDLKREQLRQQNDLKKLFIEIRRNLANRECRECKLLKQKPVTAEKSSETDDSMILTDRTIENMTAIVEENTEPIIHNDFIQEKILADERDKICPMCGKTFSREIKFDIFTDHVQKHFIENDSSLDHFELVSHTVGDF